MALAGVGVDIVSIERMSRVLERTPSFATRVFTDEERAYCESCARPAEHYACRFAAREAVLKALGTGFSDGVGVSDVSVTRDRMGRPEAVLSGRAIEVARQAGVEEVAISLSFTNEMAVANAVAVTRESRPKLDEKPTPAEELASSFREARSIIDELERVQTKSTGGAPEEGASVDEGSAVAESVGSES
ncbi:MAG: holo-ACP synthase [Atopobiaceae bacterium]|jgi:holo-[acyl-carrier protein] synthase|nr:holo-ACP synthase [Atopobiaceae bacterium]MCI2174099.1 holo-ACP synthase [Atopobiaceae bacterium]MCI2206740.1 holo-ACP synthase [Atopobiaceae bacterium]